MKAIFQQRYGASSVLQYGDLPTPAIQPTQVLVAVHATSVNPRDWLIRSGKYQLQFLVPAFPLVLGSDIAGTIVEVGSRVKQFKKGDQVIAMKNPSAGLATYAQYVAVDEQALALKPSNLSMAEAGGLPLCSLTAWQALVGLADIKQGDKVLVIGASGGVGTFAVQIATAIGAQVTGVCSAGNSAMVKALGAVHTVDYHDKNYKATLSGYDIVFDTIGRETLNSCRTVLNAGGIYLSTIPSPLNLLQAVTTRLRYTFIPSTKRCAVVMVKARGEDLASIANLVSRHQLRTVVDSIFPLHDAAQAHDVSRSLRAKGKIILKVS